MKKLAVGILNYRKKYEFDRCTGLLKKMNINRDRVFNWDGVGQLTDRTEEYVAFWDVYDKWEMQKTDVIMSYKVESDTDLIIHSYIQHIGLRGIRYKVSDSKRTDMTQIFCQGLPGISAMVFRREWLLDLLSDQKSIEIGSEEFYRLLYHKFTDSRCNIESIAEPLSEHWSYYGSKTPSVRQAKDHILGYWNAVDMETRNRMLPVWYEYFKANYGEFSVTEFFEGISMNENELAEMLRMREEALTGQLQAANSLAERKNDFYMFMRNWVELHQAGMSIADRLIQEGIATVAIYGAGKHGKMLYNELKETKVKAAYWIDKSCREESIEGCPIINADQELPLVDAVIVTPYREFPAIESLLREKTKARIIPMDTLVRR